ncbi:LysR substrate-binding domain-containing protein [Erwinia pyri]|uniref:LysR substrate-binding domain-containing protein n=1 Tax=Erwinia pyri TaxID=3062598 RepID=A0AA50DIM3_9GAMM|nr:LysR substrate-binding domain-containing protein [Erwinia sp. DE2]WLS78580.1 LysR substrate-binding domain-containing protein [Erwinia sp. DE2]
MNDLKQYAVFAEVVASGSMSAAARRLNLTPSAVSQIISTLERQFGVSLLHRSTRKLVLTDAGERCYPHCLRLLEARNSAAASLELARDAPGGELKIAAPLGFGAYVAPALAPLLAEWPQLRLSLLVDDELTDLVASRIDVALRVGSLPDSSWVGRKLGDMETVLCASPAYLERWGAPQMTDDLYHHHWLSLMNEVHYTATTNRTNATPLPTFQLHLMDENNKPEKITLAVRTTTTNQITLQQMCEQGAGIARLFYPDVRAALEHGILVRVLPTKQLPFYPLTLLTSERHPGQAKIKMAVSALTSFFSFLPTVKRHF